MRTNRRARRPYDASPVVATVRRPYLALNGIVDAYRYWRHSSTIGRARSHQHLRAEITLTYHTLEKGLCLRPMKPWFGRDNVHKLLALLEDQREWFGPDDAHWAAVGALDAYLRGNRGHDRPAWADDVERRVARLRDDERVDESQFGGVEPTTRADIVKHSLADPESYFSSRHSIRTFDRAPVEWWQVERAVALAQFVPRVCNREAYRVRAYERGPDAAAVLELQSGNRGFGDQAAWILVITMDLRNFTHVGERNQAWVDGGMFAMNLVSAFHATGLGSCCLNWSQPVHVDRALRARTGIAEHEVVITMMAVGVIAEELSVARSNRLAVGRILERGTLSPTP